MKGNCALLVKHPIIIKIPRMKGNVIKVVPNEKKIAIAKSRHKSPIRLERRVNILAPKDF
jgi:hypothetical protein